MVSLSESVGQSIWSFIKWILFYVISLYMGSSIIYWAKNIKKSDLPHNSQSKPYSNSGQVGGSRRNYRGGNKNINQSSKPSWFSDKTYGFPYSWKDYKVKPEDENSFNDWVIYPILNFFGQWQTNNWTKYREWTYNILESFKGFFSGGKDSTFMQFIAFFLAIIFSWSFIFLISPIFTLITSTYGLFPKQEGIRLGMSFFQLFTLGWVLMTVHNLLPQLFKTIHVLFLKPWFMKSGENSKSEVSKIKNFFVDKGKWLWTLLLILTLSFVIYENIDQHIPNASTTLTGVWLIVYICLYYNIRFGMGWATDWLFESENALTSKKVNINTINKRLNK